MSSLERASRALALSYYTEEEADRPGHFHETFRGQSPKQLVDFFWKDWLNQARATLMAVRGVDGHGIEVNYWSERVVDAILSEENK